MDQEPMDEARRPLRILSLDGGGVRGLSELVVLKSIMHKLKFDLKLNYTPLPCEYFDLIGGTSTGGIIAVLLGRLRLSVDECLEIYTELSGKIFAEQQFGLGIWQNKYDHNILETCIKNQLIRLQERTVTNIIARPGALPASLSNGAHELMEDSHPEMCRTFVTATWKHDVQMDNPVLFRTYAARGEIIQASPDCEIWKALRATSAAPTFFDSIEIGGMEYVDGGFGCNNPAEIVYEEAKKLWPGRDIGCIVSIGTGVPKVQSVPTTRFDFIYWILSIQYLTLGQWFQMFSLVCFGWLDVLQRVATDCNNAHEFMTRRFKRQNKYFRFNVQQGAQGIALDSWRQLPDLAAHTETYLREEEMKRKRNMVVKILTGL